MRGIEEQRRREGVAIPRHVREMTDKGCAIYNLVPESEEKLELTGEAENEKLEHEQDALKKTVYQPYPIQWEATGENQVYDELTGEPLPMNLVEKARKEEIDFMLDWRVWDEVPVAKAWQVTGKGPLGGRWVDVNKGDATTPNVRCRYVAKEIAFWKSDDFFAATPPLEALRMLISRAATGRTTSAGGRKIMVIDARKAHLHAMTERDVFVELPPEIRKPGVCARLRRCLYGTRDAPARWEVFLTRS